MMRKSRTLLASTALLGLSVAGTASAQESTGNEQRERGGLSEIVVTAERRVTNLQETPLAITAISTEELESTVAGGLDDLAAFIPNVNITFDGGYGRSNPQFNIRGVGSGVITGGAVTERPVGLYIDGVYFARVQGSLLSVIDAERIEVLRGPQGTLFGRNSTGGAISYFSKLPSQTFEGDIRLRVGEWGQREAKATLNLPLSDTLAVRGTAAVMKQDGYVMRGETDLGNSDDWVGRLQLRYEPSADLSIDLGYTHSLTKTNGDARDITEWNLNGTDGPGGAFQALELLLVNQGEDPFVEDDPRLVLDNYTVADYCILNNPNPYIDGPECDTKLRGEMDIVNGTIELRASDAISLKSITGYISGGQVSNNDWVWSGAYLRPFEHNFESFSQELQVNYAADRLNAVAGLVYFHEDSREEEVTTEVTRGSGSFALTDEEILAGASITRRDENYQALVDSFGAFAQATYSLTERLDLTGGVRYSIDKKTVNIEYNPTPDDPRDVSGGGSDKWDAFDWRLAGTYQATDDLMFYVSATKAYKAGIANDASLENRANTDNIILFLPPEKALGYEAGIRSEWFDRRLRLNLTAYRTEYTNRQSSQLVTDPTSGILVVESINLGDVNFKGVEGEMALAVTDEFTLQGSVGLSDYEQVDNPENALSNVPKSSFTIGGNYDHIFDNGAEINASLRYAWKAESYSQPGATDAANQRANPAYGLLSGRIEFTPEHGTWSFAVFGSNLLDEYYSVNSTAQTFHIGFGGRSVVAAYVGRPRSVGAELNIFF